MAALARARRSFPACCTITARRFTRWRSGPAFLNSLGLERYGLQWRWPEIDCAHPLDSGDAGVLRRSLDDTAAGLGGDGPGGGRCSAGPSATFDALAEDIMGPLLRVPNHPLALARFGLPTDAPRLRVRPGLPH